MQKKTIGDMLSESRRNNGLSFAELEDRTGVSRGVLQKIESGETKRPEFKTVKSIAAIFPYPYEEIIEGYLEDENRSETLFEILQEVIQCEYSSLVERVSLKFLQSPNEKTEKALERLYGFADTNAIAETNNEIRLALYKVIANYARQCGEPIYIAKALFKKYLIERDDFTKLPQTYQSGEQILQYAEFLSPDERILLHYKLGVHAYNLGLFDDCIKLCKHVLKEDGTDSRIKADSTLAICNSHYYSGDYGLSEKYLELFSHYSYPHVTETVKVMEGAINGKKGNLNLAITQLQACLSEATGNNIIHIVNELFELYLKSNDVHSIENLLKYEGQMNNVNIRTPFKKTELAYYFRLKGDYKMRLGLIRDAVDSYLKATLEYAKVSSHEKGYECVNQILNYYTKNKKEMDYFVINNIQKVYNELIISR
ncbi:helix-turn-helix transcriptional regulator [Brevibacillus porteri]|uniref:helix-turn-helix domain-containing protein n=1 Tax=Brevibacillus porteri TaxID=2126350 RepID=UPI003D1C22F4